jgi:hypothetical protein
MLDTRVELQIGKTRNDKLRTDFSKGRYPVWKMFEADEIV